MYVVLQIIRSQNTSVDSLMMVLCWGCFRLGGEEYSSGGGSMLSMLDDAGYMDANVAANEQQVCHFSANF